MSRIDEIISNINPQRKSSNLNKTELWEFIKESLKQIDEINEEYKKYFEQPKDQDAPAVFEDIEDKVQKIRDTYKELFEELNGTSKIDDLNEKIDEIKGYHTSLLEGDESIKSEVETAHEKINEFRTYLFGDDTDNGIEQQVKDAADFIIGHQETIAEFEQHLNQEIKPSIQSVQKDIDTQRREVGALLSNATARTLASAYAESKHEYSIPAKKEHIEGKKVWNFFIFLFNYSLRYLGIILNYALFIAPLVFIVLMFTYDSVAQLVIDGGLTTGQSASKSVELVLVRVLISVPLAWVAWYGQRNLSHRKRLSEEYNHKQRVVQMYLMFIAGDQSTYNLDNKARLEEILLEAIARNPSEIYGKGETMLDGLKSKFQGDTDVGAE